MHTARENKRRNHCPSSGEDDSSDGGSSRAVMSEDGNDEIPSVPDHATAGGAHGANAEVQAWDQKFTGGGGGGLQAASCDRNGAPRHVPKPSPTTSTAVFPWGKNAAARQKRRGQQGSGWFWGGKDTKSTKMNQHPRPADLQQQRTLSSAVVLNRPKHSNDHILPDGFEIVHRYKQCLRNRSAVLHHVTVTRAGEVEALKLRRFFLGLSGHYANHELKLATISPQTKKSLVEAGAIPHNSALQAEHLRHSSLSYAYFAVPDQLQTALLRSRHSRDVFLKCYDLPIADEQRIALEALDSTELDVIMLG